MIGLLASLIGGRGGRMLGGMIGGRTGAMVGGLAGSILGGRQLGRLGRSLFNKKQRGGRPSSEVIEDDVITDQDAATLIRVMCNSAKADGHVDEDESQLILNELGDEVSADERAFLERELAAPLRPADALAREVPEGLRAEAYAVSLLAIDADTVAEAEYLQRFAGALGLTDQQRAGVHTDLGVDNLS